MKQRHSLLNVIMYGFLLFFIFSCSSQPYSMIQSVSDYSILTQDDLVSLYSSELVFSKNIQIVDELPSRIIELHAQAEYSNSSRMDLVNLKHYFTIPVSSMQTQVLLSVSGEGFHSYDLYPHQNGIDYALRLYFDLPAQETISLHLVYRLLLIPIDYTQALMETEAQGLDPSISNWLEPTRNIESEHPIIRDQARIFLDQSDSIYETIRQCYEFPAQNIDYKVQSGNLGALGAIRMGVGDCTEYAQSFTALARAAGIPARTFAVFNMGESFDREYRMPNHVAAEFYLDTTGWIPVDPNLGMGSYVNDHQLGFTSNSIVYLKREGAWVYSRARNSIIPEDSLEVQVTWRGVVLAEGGPFSLFHEYYYQPAGGNDL